MLIRKIYVLVGKMSVNKDRENATSSASGSKITVSFADAPNSVTANESIGVRLDSEDMGEEVKLKNRLPLKKD